MVKKLVGIALLGAATVASAQMKEKGVLVGVDYTNTKTELTHENNVGAVKNYSQDVTNGTTGFKVGYQYYFTRIYFRYNKIDLNDEKRDKYTIDGDRYELNAEYIPKFYENKDKSWMIRGLFGGMAGYNSSKVSVTDTNLLPTGITSTSVENNRFVYGFQAGLLLESKWGVSLEGGMRYRKNTYVDVDDGNYQSTFYGTDKEYFVGLNYLF